LKKYYQSLPELVYSNLSTIDELLKPTIKGYSTDNLKEVISIVACHVRKDEKSTPLQMRYINKLVPQGQLYLTGLVNLGIIDRSGTAIKGQASYKYSFAPEYQSKYKTIPLENAKLILRIETVHEKLRKESDKTYRGYLNQTKYLKRLTLADNYNDFIESNYTAGTDQYNSIVASATRILNGDIFYSVDSTSGRFHQ